MGHPVWMYRKDENGVAEAKLFDSEDIPEGWSDSPEAAALFTAPKRGRPPKDKGSE